MEVELHLIISELSYDYEKFMELENELEQYITKSETFHFFSKNLQGCSLYDPRGNRGTERGPACSESTGFYAGWKDLYKRNGESQKQRVIFDSDYPYLKNNHIPWDDEHMRRYCIFRWDPLYGSSSNNSRQDVPYFFQTLSLYHYRYIKYFLKFPLESTRTILMNIIEQYNIRLQKNEHAMPFAFSWNGEWSYSFNFYTHFLVSDAEKSDAGQSNAERSDSEKSDVFALLDPFVKKSYPVIWRLVLKNIQESKFYIKIESGPGCHKSISYLLMESFQNGKSDIYEILYSIIHPRQRQISELRLGSIVPMKLCIIPYGIIDIAWNLSSELDIEPSSESSPPKYTQDTGIANLKSRVSELESKLTFKEQEADFYQKKYQELLVLHNAIMRKKVPEESFKK